MSKDDVQEVIVVVFLPIPQSTSEFVKIFKMPPF